MPHNERNDFFESEPVKQMLMEAFAAGYINLRFVDIEYKDSDFNKSIYRHDDSEIVMFTYIRNMLQFVDDVAHDRFDLHTLTNDQFNHLYTMMICKYSDSSLLYKIKEYRSGACIQTTIFILPEYFTLNYAYSYWLKDMSADEAYTKLADCIEIGKMYKTLCDNNAHEVFYNKIKQVADERKTIKQLNAE